MQHAPSKQGPAQRNLDANTPQQYAQSQVDTIVGQQVLQKI
jgi:hypothetical protein